MALTGMLSAFPTACHKMDTDWKEAQIFLWTNEAREYAYFVDIGENRQTDSFDMKENKLYSMITLLTVKSQDFLIMHATIQDPASILLTALQGTYMLWWWI